jgi:hypothetical protein
MVATLAWMVVALLAVQDKPAAVPAGWQTYTSARGGFSAAYPTKPSEVVKKVKLGDEARNMVVATAKQGLATFTIGSTEAPDGAQLFDAARDELASSLKAKVESEDDVVLEGHPGRALELSIPRQILAGGGKGWVRHYAVGNRLFRVVAIQTASGPQSRPRDAEAFLKSFKPTDLPKAKPAEIAKAGQSPAEPNAKLVDPAFRAAGNEAPIQNPPADEKLPAGWVRFAPAGDPASVAMPKGEPVPISQTVPTVLGQIRVQVYTLAQPEGTYQLMFTDAVDYKPGTPGDEYLKGVQFGFLNSIRGTMVKEKAFEVGEHPARDLEAELAAGGNFPQGGSLRTRFVLIPGKVVQATLIAPKGQMPASATTFLESLRITPGANPGAPAAGTPRTSGNAGPLGGLLNMFGRPGAAGAAPPQAGAAPPAASNPVPPPGGPVREVKGEPKIPAGWVVQHPQDQSYSMAFPQTPKSMQVPGITPQGQKFSMETLMVDAGPKGAYILMMQPLPPAPGVPADQLSENAFEGGIQNMMKTTPGKLISQSNLKVEGFPARDVEYQPNTNASMPGGAVMLMRIVIANNTLYVLIRGGSADLDRSEAALFFDSFRPARK